MSHAFDFHDDPAAFAEAAADLLAARPLESTVVATVTARLQRLGFPERPAQAPVPWWVVVRDGDRVVGAAMRTAHFEPFPAYLLAMPDDAATALAGVLHARGEQVPALGGDAAAVTAFAREAARLRGGVATPAHRMSLQEVTAVLDPPEPAGGLRAARLHEVDVVLPWFDAFNADASEQAGHEDPHPGPIETRESTLARIENGEIWVWEVDGVPVHVTAFNPARFGVARIGPVYTPRERRGSGYAAAAVARIARMLLDTGARVCLFVDEDNPVSYALYGRLGFKPLATMADYSVVDR